MEYDDDAQMEEMHDIDEEPALDTYEDEDEDGNEDDRIQLLDESEKQANTNRITTKYMTKYERARVLGTRALQIR